VEFKHRNERQLHQGDWPMQYVLINRHPAVFPTNCCEAGLRACECYVLHLPKLCYSIALFSGLLQNNMIKNHAHLPLRGQHRHCLL